MNIMQILEDCGTPEVVTTDLSEKIRSNLERNGPASFAIIRNRLRRRKPKDIAEAMQRLADDGSIDCTVTVHPITGRKTPIFSLVEKNLLQDALR